MGQQQLLLLVLSIVLVGLAVVVGLSRFEQVERKDRFERQLVYMYDLGGHLMARSNRPKAMGGGGGSSDYFNSANTVEAMRSVGIEIDTSYTSKHMGWKQPGLGCFMISFEGHGAHLHPLDEDENGVCERDSWNDNPWYLVSPTQVRYREGPRF